MQWYYTVSSQTFGPFDEELLLQWIRTGALPSDVLVWREGMDGWQPALRAFPDAGLPLPPPPSAVRPSIVFGGFWLRLLALVIDYFVVSFAIGLVVSVFSVPTGVPDSFQLDPANPGIWLDQIAGQIDTAALLRYNLLTAALTCLYHAVLVASPLQATLGKLAVGLKVVGPDGGRVSLLRAVARHLSREWVSGLLTMGFGYFLVPFDDRRRALHDRIAGTLVVARPTPPAAVAALNGRPAPHERNVRPSGSART